MLKINAEVILQGPLERSNGRSLPPRYFYGKKRGNVVVMGVTSQSNKAPIRLLLTTDGVRRLEETLHLIRSIGRDVSIGIWPKEVSNGRRGQGRRPARRHSR